jgi:hypothetical protein
LNNGDLSSNDFRDAANYAAPAVVSGSKESITWNACWFVCGVKSKTLITTADGHVQVFNEKGIGGGLIGISGSATHGAVWGLETKTPGKYDPLKYSGGATQGNISIPTPLCWDLCGPTGEGYVSDDRKVKGLDGGLSLGPNFSILSGAHTTATQTDNAHGKIPTQLTGGQLLICRLLSMCGAK